MRRLAILLLLLAVTGCPTTEEPAEPSLCDWTMHPDNPLIEAPGSEHLLGDPTVVHPDESPDGRWHLFANSMLGIHHYVSDDGVAWDMQQQSVVGVGAWRPHVHLHGSGTYHMTYEFFADITHSEIQRIESADLESWSDPVTVITPELSWEMKNQETVGNPFLTYHPDEYWLYYSTSGVELWDTGFREPMYIGVAWGTSIDSEYGKSLDPILGPDPDDPWRNLGAGSLKELDEPEDGRRIAFNNGIYDTGDHTGSAIRVLASDNGLDWELRCDEPIVAPTGEGWTTAFVYAFDSVRNGDEIWLYFNARDGWEVGSERIGLATAYWPAE